MHLLLKFNAFKAASIFCGCLVIPACSPNSEGPPPPTFEPIGFEEVWYDGFEDLKEFVPREVRKDRPASFKEAVDLDRVEWIQDTAPALMGSGPVIEVDGRIIFLLAVRAAVEPVRTNEDISNEEILKGLKSDKSHARWAAHQLLIVRNEKRLPYRWQEDPSHPDNIKAYTMWDEFLNDDDY